MTIVGAVVLPSSLAPAVHHDHLSMDASVDAADSAVTREVVPEPEALKSVLGDEEHSA
jgi:hypothetical protein